MHMVYRGRSPMEKATSIQNTTASMWHRETRPCNFGLCLEGPYYTDDLEGRSFWQICQQSSSLCQCLYQHLSSLRQQLSFLDICLVIPRHPLHAHRRTLKHNFPRTRATALVCGIRTHLSIVTGRTAPTVLF